VVPTHVAEPQLGIIEVISVGGRQRMQTIARHFIDRVWQGSHTSKNASSRNENPIPRLPRAIFRCLNLPSSLSFRPAGAARTGRPEAICKDRKVS